ncbi:MAG: UDP-N-acetylglucosamine 2-epimerase (non-hydrolyzing) [Methanomassiliicoccales archaeon]|nr:UDP-N-acetylglucosamine 2-epimerase (non-hydrolyzing) [Methanomassiliicoccales archaeon]
MKILSIVGARPQFVKVSPVHKAVSKRHEHSILHTGQHYDYQMSQVFFEELNIPVPDYYLGVGSGSHGAQTGKMLAAIEEVLIKDRPDLMLVYGDTNSTLAGALAAVKMGIPIGHIEAGLRSYRHGMPEEINRVLTDHVSDLLFCPSQISKDNLKKEGVSKGVHVVGDTMTEVLLDLEDRINDDVLDKLGVKKGDYVLCTIHRQENADDRKNMEEIIGAVISSDRKFVIPLHPRTRKNLAGWNMLSGLERADNVVLTEPQNFMAFTSLEKNAAKIMTDSGGVQKEAYFFGVPCVTVRDETEWVETLQDGWNVLVGAHRDSIASALAAEKPLVERGTSYGDSRVSERIVRLIEEHVKV